MAGFADLIKTLINDVAKPLTNDLRTPVLWTKQTGRTAYGPIYGLPSKQTALIEAAGETVASADGTEKVSSSKFTFFDPITIAEGDRLTVNGVTATVIKVGGLLDPDGKPYLPQAWTGKQ